MPKTILVTGISGFVAKRTAIAFLEAGHAVRGTLRDGRKADGIQRVLGALCDVSRLSFAEADLMSDAGWDAAVSGCDGVVHVASPVFLRQPNDESEAIRPAVEGTLRVLAAAARAGVGRFVHTSSITAVVEGHGERPPLLSEAHWTDVEGPHVSPYSKSKTLAERAAREFAANSSLHYSSINPGFVFGPVLDAGISASVEIVRMLLQGRYPGTPRLAFAIVDVRDVARAHLRAFETDRPSGGRYIAVSETLWLREVARVLRDGLGEQARRVPRRELPDFLVRAIGLFDPVVRQVTHDLGRPVALDNRAAREQLGIEFLPAREAVLASAESLIRLGLL